VPHRTVAADKSVEVMGDIEKRGIAMAAEDRERVDAGMKFRRVSGLLSNAGVCIALAAALVAVSAGFGSRLGLWQFRTGFALLKWAACGGLLAALLSVAGGFHALKQRQVKRCLLALLGVAVGVTAAAVPLSWKLGAGRVPPIHDITTDIDRPPVFVAVLPLRKDAPNPAEYGGGEVAIKQRAAYPDISTVILNLPHDQAFRRALDVARAMGWEVVAEVPAEGRIEATATTFWFGFKDDVVIRITPADHRSLLDIRSVSRVGRSDAGTNAARIREFVRRLTAA
jgi:uncharacterized protein (DUF1499 family)